MTENITAHQTWREAVRKSGGTFHLEPLLLVSITASHYLRTGITVNASVITHARNNPPDRKEVVVIAFSLGCV